MVLEKTLESPLDCKEIQPVHPKGNQSWIFIGLTDAKAEYSGHLIWRTDSFEKTLMLGKIESGKRKGQQRMRWLDGIINLMGLSFSKLQGLVIDREAWRAIAHGVAKSRTQLSNWTELNFAFRIVLVSLYKSKNVLLFSGRLYVELLLFLPKLFGRFYQRRHLELEFYFFSGIMVTLITISSWVSLRTFYLFNLSNILP